MTNIPLEDESNLQMSRRVLVTGAFGNVGSSTLPALLAQGHTVRAFDMPSDRNRKKSRAISSSIELAWGDIRDLTSIEQAVDGQEVVIHLAAIIPPHSSADPDLAQAVNVGGTENVLAALQAMPVPAHLIYTSSLALFGPTQHLPPPRTLDDPIQLTDAYTHHKAECERLIAGSSLTWSIFRLAAVLPLQILRGMDPIMFEVPLADRIETVHPDDVGLALANGVRSESIWGKILLIGGGSGCQIDGRRMIELTLRALGIGMLPEQAFSITPFHTDWLDTSESQKLLSYQRHDFDEYIDQVRALLGWRRYVIRLASPLVRRWLVAQSPYYRQAKTADHVG